LFFQGKKEKSKKNQQKRGKKQKTRGKKAKEVEIRKKNH